MSSEPQGALDPHVVKVLDTDCPYRGKSPVVGHFNCLGDAHSKNRNLKVTVHPSRAVLKHEIHELIVTDEPDAGMGTVVNRVAYLAFCEIDEGGMILVGDKVEVDGQDIGTVAGFNLIHADNHINICIKGKGPGPARSGLEMGFKVGSKITFSFIGPEQAKMIAR
jgi:hypothetical protein